ncbi:BTB/POZ domain-containing protein POB1 [Triticum urartu]|uniref:BTB/POZ domain-containing protein POB1 n=1 Tax=Triticum urartu TaxID=4572 RepID=M7YR40_TRIUA|nr:BTB/POZ domain-containing protein POB1 [Triticum urartu]
MARRPTCPPSSVLSPPLSLISGAPLSLSVPMLSATLVLPLSPFPLPPPPARVTVAGSNTCDSAGGDEEDIDTSCTVMGTPIIQVKTIHVSSVILAAKSSFFLKLFSNGMKESGQTQATVRVADSEEKAFMELLGFMYSGKLTPTEPTLLLDILMAADKFEVVSCMKLCGQRLIDLSMNLESAVRCLDLPCCISMADALQEAAQKFFAESGRYKKFPEFQDELMRVPFLGIMAILTRNDLEVASEVAAYDFVIRWACSWYPDSEESRRILSSFLIPTIRDFNVNEFSKVYSLVCSVRPMYPGYLNVTAITMAFSPSTNKISRSMNFQNLKIISFDRSGKFVTCYKGTFTTDREEAVGRSDLFGIPWSEFIADNSPFFVDNELHLRVNVKIRA